MILTVGLSLPIGLLLGLLGGGGSILTVPMLVYVLGIEPKAAILTSFVVVGVSSLMPLSITPGNTMYAGKAVFSSDWQAWPVLMAGAV